MMLKTEALRFGCGVMVAALLIPQSETFGADRPSVTTSLDRTVEYVLSCRRPNGAFGPHEQEYTDAAWNYPAVHTLRLLGAPILARDAVLKYGLSYPSGHAGYGHWLVYHQSLTRWLLNERPETRQRPPVTLAHQGFETRYYGSAFGTGGDLFFNTDGQSTGRQFQEASQLGYYNLSSLYYLIASVLADGREIADSQPLIEFIQERQAPNGGFVDLRSAGAEASNDEVHLAHTFHAVAALRLLGAEIPRREACMTCVRACQLNLLSGLNRDAPEHQIGVGGFRFAADAGRPGNFPDVYYTWCGLQVLSLLGSEPESPESCIDWLSTLQNHDGGFGDRPGWRSRLYSTYYAVHSLALLSRITDDSGRADTTTPLQSIIGQPLSKSRHDILRQRPIPLPARSPRIASNQGIYQALNKSPVVEPEHLSELHRRGINLLAMKTDDFAAAERLLPVVSAQRFAMDIVLCPEAYPHRLLRHGRVELHHVGNFTLNPDWDQTRRTRWLAADAAGRKSLLWTDYKREVLQELQQLGSVCYPEQDFELEFAYSAYDDGVYGRGGYNAVQVGFNWAPRDFVRVFPWRERYVDKLVPVADADAHGDLTKWSSQLDHTRHLFIANGPTYADFLEAARHRRVVCVVVGTQGVPSGVSYYGPPEAVQYVRARVDEWKWW